jgi:hypothetical protein
MMQSCRPFVLQVAKHALKIHKAGFFKAVMDSMKMICHKLRDEISAFNEQYESSGLSYSQEFLRF